MRTRVAVLTGLILIAGVVAAAAQMGGMMGHGMGMRGGMMGSARHFTYMHSGLPSAYARKTNPLSPTSAVLAEGRKLYAANCAICHGAEGHGDGPQALTLKPPPADLSRTMSLPIARDDFLYWTVADGGKQFGSAMPAFKSVLKPHEIWAVITALRSGELKPK